MSQLKAPRGTRDILPGESEAWQHLQDVAVEIFNRYGYRRIVTPTFESTDVFQRAIGEETEIVQKQMYTFQDKGDRSLTLRPEGTAGVVRAFIEHNMSGGQLPAKLFYAGQMFRYERPQAGRYREFWQLGVEALGSDSATLDAEVIIMLLEFYTTLGLTELVTLVNSMGCPECRPAYIELLQKYLRGLSDEDLCGECKGRAETNSLRVFDCKNEGCRAVLAAAPKISDHLCGECETRFAEVKDLLDEAQVNYVMEPTLVRGFDYYQRTTFEVQSSALGAQSAVGGGGRYDGLVEKYGGPKTPSIGFAVGCERILIALGDKASKGKGSLDCFVVAIDKTVAHAAFATLQSLRAGGINVDMDHNLRSMKSQMKQADRRGVRVAAIIGPDEAAAGQVTLRDMTGGEEQVVATADAAKVVRDIING